MSRLQSKQVQEFRIQFLLLTKKQKKIWQYLSFLDRKYKEVQTPIASICKYAKCHPDTVNVALKKFKENGWLFTKRQYNQASIYMLDHKLANIDTQHSSYFSKPRPPKKEVSRGKSVYSPCLIYNSYCTNIRTSVPHQNATEKAPPRLASHVQNLPFEDDDLKLIQRCFTELEIDYAKKQFNTLTYKPNKPIAVFMDLCNRQKRRLRPEMQY